MKTCHHHRVSSCFGRRNHSSAWNGGVARLVVVVLAIFQAFLLRGSLADRSCGGPAAEDGSPLTKQQNGGPTTLNEEGPPQNRVPNSTPPRGAFRLPSKTAHVPTLIRGTPISSGATTIKPGTTFRDIIARIDEPLEFAAATEAVGKKKKAEIDFVNGLVDNDAPQSRVLEEDDETSGDLFGKWLQVNNNHDPNSNAVSGEPQERPIVLSSTASSPPAESGLLHDDWNTNAITNEGVIIHQRQLDEGARKDFLFGVCIFFCFDFCVPVVDGQYETQSVGLFGWIWQLLFVPDSVQGSCLEICKTTEQLCALPLVGTIPPGTTNCLCLTVDEVFFDRAVIPGGTEDVQNVLKEETGKEDGIYRLRSNVKTVNSNIVVHKSISDMSSQADYPANIPNHNEKTTVHQGRRLQETEEEDEDAKGNLFGCFLFCFDFCTAVDEGKYETQTVGFFGWLWNVLFTSQPSGKCADLCPDLCQTGFDASDSTCICTDPSPSLAPTDSAPLEPESSTPAPALAPVSSTSAPAPASPPPTVSSRPFFGIYCVQSLSFLIIYICIIFSHPPPHHQQIRPLNPLASHQRVDHLVIILVGGVIRTLQPLMGSNTIVKHWDR